MKGLKWNAEGLTRLVAATGALAMAGPVAAVSIDVGNPDVQLRWDNSVRYNIGWRAQKQEEALAKSPTQHVSNNRFDRGDIVTNRIDVLSEMDFIYKERYGARVSAQAWYDDAYKDGKIKGLSEYSNAGLPDTFPSGHHTGTVQRYYEGVSAEILDAFIFGGFDIGDVPVRIKAGRHNLYWGESLFSFVHGVSYAQGPVDIRKATSTPGTEAKELFLPLNQLSFQSQLTDTLSLAGYYQFEWDPARLPEGGTYFGYADFVFSGGGQAALGPGFAVPTLGDRDKPKQSGSWGLSARWNSEALGGTLGFYYREFSDILPNPILNQVDGVFGLYNAYADNVKLYGMSLSKQVGTLSVGAELSRRENTALAPQPFQPGYARGDTWHALVNVIAMLGKNSLWDSAVLQGELTYSRLDKVTKNNEYYWAKGNAICTNQYGVAGAGDAKDGCATRDAVGLQVMFAPVWYQVANGLDVTLPITYGIGLHGASPVSNGGNEGSGNFSVGVSLDYLAQYKVDLAYNGFFGPATTVYNPIVDANVVATSSGSIPQLRDRGWVSLTFKTTF